jgi:hypothetical protein
VNDVADAAFVEKLAELGSCVESRARAAAHTDPATV